MVAVLMVAVGCGAKSAPKPAPPSHAAQESVSASPASSPTAMPLPGGWHYLPIKDWAKRGVAELGAPPRWTVTRGGGLIVAPDEIGVEPGGVNFEVSPGIGGAVASEVNRIAGVAAHTLQASGYTQMRRMPNVTYGGVPFYHLRYTGDNYLHDEYGTVTSDAEKQITISWLFHPAAIDQAGADKIINQVMPTFRLL